MEIRHYGDTILGVVANQEMEEGRMIVLAAHGTSYDFGSREDLPGARYPLTETEAARARYCVAHALDNRSLPIYHTTPAYDFALRYGWDQTENVPFDTEVHLTHFSNKIGIPIPSGSLALAFGEGIYTVPSGSYIYESDIENVGQQLTVSNVADHGDDAGKVRAGSSNIVAEVIHYDDDTGALTFKVLH
jgi:hypothetical protein